MEVTHKPDSVLTVICLGLQLLIASSEFSEVGEQP